jgi:hypothetical protein
MIDVRTGIAIATAGLGTLAAGTLVAGQPKASEQEWGTAPSRDQLLALGLGMGGLMGGVVLSTFAPGRSLKPVMATLGAGLGGMLLGQHVLGPTLGALGLRGRD